MAFLQGNSTGHIYHCGLGEATIPSAVTYVPFQWGKLDSLCLWRLRRSCSHQSCPAPQRGVQQRAGQPSSRAGAPWPLANTAVQHSNCHRDKARRRSCPAYPPIMLQLMILWHFPSEYRDNLIVTANMPSQSIKTSQVQVSTAQFELLQDVWWLMTLQYLIHCSVKCFGAPLVREQLYKNNFHFYILHSFPCNLLHRICSEFLS